MITLTIMDGVDSMTFSVIESPATLNQLINETDVETVDGNLSTYYSSTKKEYEFRLGYLDREAYSRLTAFVDRQYSSRKYPTISVDGESGLTVTSMTAKMVLSRQEVVDECGTVRNVTVNFRESKQMP